MEWGNRIYRWLAVLAMGTMGFGAGLLSLDVKHIGRALDPRVWYLLAVGVLGSYMVAVLPAVWVVRMDLTDPLRLWLPMALAYGLPLAYFFAGSPLVPWWADWLVTVGLTGFGAMVGMLLASYSMRRV